MKVLLINPPRFNGIPVIREDRCENADRDCVHPPTSLVYIAGVLREKGFEVDLLDANAENFSICGVEDWVHRRRVRGRSAEWIIFRSTPSTFYWDCKIVEIAKKYKIHTLMLNWNLHYVPEKVMQECPDLDVYINEYHYELAIPEIIGDFPYYLRSNYPKVTDISEPAWDLIDDFRKYYTRTRFLSPWAVVRGSKGCPYQCKFCIDADTGWFPRKPELIVDELEYLVKKKVKYVSFYDDTFEINADWCLNIVSEIERRKLKFKWYINSRSDLICKHGLVFFKRLKESGLDGSSLGIEFGSQEMLDASGKGTTVEQNKEAIRILYEAGVKSYVSCMIGYLGETKEQMYETMEFIKETKPTGFQINTVVPYNGTVLHKEAKERGLIDESKFDWRGLSCIPTTTIPVQLSSLTLPELFALRRKIYRKIYLSSWLLSNMSRLRSRDDLKLGVGYFLSSLGRLLQKVEFSH